jgi:hypothetical protein
MKTMKQSYPRRGLMLATPFEPLSDPAFRELVSSGLAIPGQQGSSLFVAKWRDGPGVEAEAFLKLLHAQGSTLEVRRYKTDVNVRVVRNVPPKRGSRPSPAPASKSAK